MIITIEKIREIVNIFPNVKKFLSPKTRYALARPVEYKTVEYMQNVIEGLVNGVYTNLVGGDFIDAMASLIQGQLTQAYRQAWEDEGMTDYFAPDYLSESLEAMILGQYDYVDGFYRSIIDARVDGTSISPLLERAKLWAARWQDAYNEAIRLIAKENGDKLEWVLGSTEEHCPECSALDGIVMRASEWDVLGVKPQSPENTHLTCGGWRCDCSFVITDKRRSPNAYGRVEEILLSKK